MGSHLESDLCAWRRTLNAENDARRLLDGFLTPIVELSVDGGVEIESRYFKLADGRWLLEAGDDRRIGRWTFDDAGNRRFVAEGIAPPHEIIWRDALRAWWAATEAISTFYTVFVARHDCAPTPPPIDVMRTVSSVAGYLAVGNLPATVIGVTSQGRKNPGPDELHDIGLAVAYIMAAKDGFQHIDGVLRVKDSTPIKTIADLFGASVPTVRQWPSKFAPAVFGLTGASSEDLKRLVERAGERYARSGRSQSAIEGRGPKAK